MPSKQADWLRILFLLPALPYPPQAGAAIRNLHLIKALAQHNTITLLTFAPVADPAAGAAAIAELSKYCRQVAVVAATSRPRWRRLVALPGPTPDLADRLASADLVGRGRALVATEPFDVVHIGGLELAPAGLAIVSAARRADRHPAALVFDEHNAEYLLQRRVFENELRLGGSPVGAAYSLLQWRKLQRYEARIARRADEVVAVSEADRQAIIKLAPGASVSVVPNAIDLADYLATGRPRELAWPPVVLFTGKMDFRPNIDAVVWFCRRVFPLVRLIRPDARFQIVGRDPVEAVRRLADLPGVEVIGPVENDRQYLSAAAVFVVPMRAGGGVRIKILQAMAAGVPLVATTLGYEGIAATPGHELVVADEPAEFARAVVDLLNVSPDNTESRQTELMIERARSLVAARYDWRMLTEPLDVIYRRAAARPAHER